MTDTNNTNEPMEHHDDKKTLRLVRGLPGSGKSYFAKSNGQESFEADDYFIDPETGEYVYDGKKIQEAHRDCQNRTSDAAIANQPLIVVSNTFTQRWEMFVYAFIAQLYGYELQIVEPSTEWAKDPVECAARNQHHVPEKTIRDMLNRWQQIPENDPVMAILSSRTKFETNNYLSYIPDHPIMIQIIESLKKLRSHIGDEKFFQMIRNKDKRDGLGAYHITILSPTAPILREKGKKEKGPYLKGLVDQLSKTVNANNLQIKGIGHVEGVAGKDNSPSEAYFLVVEWQEMTDFLRENDLPEQHFHFTLGFGDAGDVFKTEDGEPVNKGIESLLEF